MNLPFSTSPSIIPLALLVIFLTACEPSPVQHLPLSVSVIEFADPETSNTLKGSPHRWYPAQALCLEGRGWEMTDRPFDRLPPEAEGLVPELVWERSKRTSGVVVRFVSDTKEISVEWNGAEFLDHELARALGGLELYVWDGRAWQACGSARPDAEVNRATLVQDASGLPGNQSGGLREYLLYFPLRSAVTELFVGIPPEARIAPGPERPESRRKPIVFYGTSITQGMFASRAGLGHTSIISRRLDREVINLGFSSLGKMEIEMAELLAEIDAGVYIVDCLPNMDEALVVERFERFVRRLRELRPETPIILPEDPKEWRTNPMNLQVRTIFGRLQAGGIHGLTRIRGDRLIQDRPDRWHFEGHPTDVGFRDMAEAFEKPIRRVLKIDS